MSNISPSVAIRSGKSARECIALLTLTRLDGAAALSTLFEYQQEQTSEHESADNNRIDNQLKSPSRTESVRCNARIQDSGINVIKFDTSAGGEGLDACV